MSACYGWLSSDKGDTTRAGHKYIGATVGTWDGVVTVEVMKNGDYRVTVGPHPSGGGRTVEVAVGNFKTGGRGTSSFEGVKS